MEAANSVDRTSLKIDDGLRWKERVQSGAIEGNQVTKYFNCTRKDI